MPAEDGKLRFWRNTSIATLGTGQTATLPVGTLGYEWDSDLDNGFRPSGLMRLSSTTLTFGGMLLDYGSNYGPGTQTHALTLYRHASGARVFGAGTIQWSWGLDANHDRGGMPIDSRMQQATVNLFADMGAQPTTLLAGMVPASASVDLVAPSSAVASPTQGATVAPGVAITISGTATDAGGGVVAGVEVSVDGGTTWRRANGRATWSYGWTPPTSGSVTIRSRAVDDSGNLEPPSAGVTVSIGGGGPQNCPCTIWPSSAVPTVVSDSDTGSVNLGVKFRSDVDGYITGIRFYKGAANTGTHVGTLWSSAGAQLASATFTNETASGWQQVNFSTPVAVTANTVYVASYLAPNGRYAGDNSFFASAGVDNAPLHALQNGVNGGNGVYAYAASTTFPASSYQSSNYWVDVVFTTAAPGDTTPPTVTAVSPADGATSVGISASVSATFSEAMNAASIGSSSFELRTSAGAPITAVVSYNAATRVATLTPNVPLAASTTYNAVVTTGVTDAAGNAMIANRTWSFTTAAAADTTPPVVTVVVPASGATGISPSTTVGATFSEAMDPATIGVATFELRNATSGALVAASVGYNAATNTATLTPSALLASQTAYTATITVGVKDVAGNAMTAPRTWSFTTAAAADTTPPVVTVVAPASGATGISPSTTVGATFSEAMDLATIGVTTFELRNASSGALVAAVVGYNAATNTATLTPNAALASSTAYTATVTVGVTDLAGNAMGAPRTWSFTTAAAGDTTPPTITARSPAVNATNVSRTANVTVTFSEAMNASTIGTSTIELRDPSNNLVAAAVSYSTTSRVATLNPTPTLAFGTVYTVVVRGGATGSRVMDLAGNALATDASWSYTTVPDTTAPTVSAISPADGATGISTTANVTATFNEVMDESTINASTVTLTDASGSVVPADLTYTASNRRVTLNPIPNLVGGAIYTARVRGGVDGVKDAAQNPLAVDRVWTFTIEATPPTVTSTSPASGATGVSRTANITATFSEAMDPATLTAGTVELRGPTGTLVPAVVTVSTNNRTVTLNPTPTLTALTVYTVTIKGGTGAARVTDLAGNAMAADRVWSFTTR